jgi:ATP-dependent exoDNAse (exonuclease V) alpha subunit
LPRKTPDRLLWVKTTFDGGTPIALIARSDFSKWHAHYVQRTLWTDEQFERRLNRRVLLPREHSKEDMLKIAKAHLPNGDSPSWKLLAAYALASEKNQASGIVEALESAIYRAKQDGRDEVMFNDIQAALIHDHGFAPAARASQSEFAKPQKHPCKRAAADIREQCKAAKFQLLAPAEGRRERVPIPI